MTIPEKIRIGGVDYIVQTVENLDPDTGLVPCGCGGRATITENSLNWEIKCAECGIQLVVYGGRGGAVWSWNTAMGWREPND